MLFFVGGEDRLISGKRSMVLIFYLVSLFSWLGMNAGAEELSLKVIGKEVGPDSFGEGQAVRYTLVNTSDKTITAWVFGCVLATQLGDGAFGFTQSDAYQEDAAFRLRGEVREPGSSQLLRPGAIQVQSVPLLSGQLDGPYAAKSCKTVALVYADATAEGDSRQLAGIFERRAQDGIDARRAGQGLRLELSRDADLAAAMERIGRQLDRKPEEPGSDNFSTDQLLFWAGWIREGKMPADAKLVLDALEDQYQAALMHLPPEARARVDREVRP